jgi:hypothetical protein
MNKIEKIIKYGFLIVHHDLDKIVNIKSVWMFAFELGIRH